MEFSSRSIGLLISGFLCLLLAGFVFWQYRKRRIARALASTMAVMAGYCWLISGLAAAQSEGIALLWLRIFMPFAYMLAASCFRFSMLFSKTNRPWAKYYLNFAYGMVLVLSLIKIFNLSNGAAYVEGQGWFPAHDPVYSLVYAPFLGLTLILSLTMVLLRIVNSKPGFERNNLYFYFIGFGSAFALDTVQLYRPLAFLSAFSCFACAGVLTYAISRHRLFDLSIVVKKGAIAAGLAFAAAVGLVALLLTIQELLIAQEIGHGSFFMISSAVWVTAILLIIWRPFTAWINRALGVRNLSLEQQLLEYSSLLAKHVQFDAYVESALSKLNLDMGLSKSWVLLQERAGAKFSGSAGGLSGAKELDAQSPLVAALSSGMACFEYEELMSMASDEEGEEAEAKRRILHEMESMGATVVVAIRCERNLDGLLFLGPKVSNAIFSLRELDFVQALAIQIGAALENWRLHTQIQQAERLSTLGTLAASLAHELRNPLTSISTFVQMFPARYADADFREKFERIVGKEISKLTRLTDQLLNFSRPSSSARASLNLLQLSDRVRQLLRYQFAKKNVAIEIGGALDEVLVSGNETELSQVLINLLLNALQATPGGGKVQISVRVDDSRVLLEVADDGEGITPTQIKHIFEPFYTTKEGGSGLGLPTCQRIIERHGGLIEVQSALGEGSIFTVKLPIFNPAQLVATT